MAHVRQELRFQPRASQGCIARQGQIRLRLLPHGDLRAQRVLLSLALRLTLFQRLGHLIEAEGRAPNSPVAVLCTPSRELAPGDRAGRHDEFGSGAQNESL